MQESEEKVCEICGATTKESCYIGYSRKANKFLCNKHRLQFSRHGFFYDYTIYDNNNYVIHNDYAEMELRSKYGDILGYAKIDLDDISKCKKYKWGLAQIGYVQSRINGKIVSLHRYIIECPEDRVIDHINRDKLDNRKINLRIVSRSENNVNRECNNNTGYVNIIETPSHTFAVTIDRDCKRIYGKRHKTIAEAIVARDKALAEYNKEHNRVC